MKSSKKRVSSVFAILVMAIVLVVSIVFSVLLSSTSIAFAESDGESSEAEGSDVTNDENQDETTKDFDLKADWAEMNIKERTLVVLFIAGIIMVAIALILGLINPGGEIICIIVGVVETIGSIFIGIVIRAAYGEAFRWPWWGCMLYIIWSLMCAIGACATRIAVGEDADGKVKIIRTSADTLIIASLIVLPLVF